MSAFLIWKNTDFFLYDAAKLSKKTLIRPGLKHMFNCSMPDGFCGFGLHSKEKS